MPSGLFFIPPTKWRFYLRIKYVGHRPPGSGDAPHGAGHVQYSTGYQRRYIFEPRRLGSTSNSNFVHVYSTPICGVSTWHQARTLMPDVPRQFRKSNRGVCGRDQTHVISRPISFKMASPIQKPFDDQIEEIKHASTLVALHKHPRPSDRPEDPLNWPLGLKVSTQQHSPPHLA